MVLNSLRVTSASVMNNLGKIKRCERKKILVESEFFIKVMISCIVTNACLG